jgi:hypothetical protein
VVIWYIFPRFGILCQEKSGNPCCQATPSRETKAVLTTSVSLTLWTECIGKAQLALATFAKKEQRRPLQNIPIYAMHVHMYYSCVPMSNKGTG